MEIKLHDSFPEEVSKRDIARELIKTAGDKVVSYPKKEDSKSLADTIYQVAQLEGKQAIRSVADDRVYYQFKDRKE